MKKTSSESCKALLVNKGKILLTLRDNKNSIKHPNCWDLPGGGKKSNEKIEEAISRELEEEVSYVPKNLYFLFNFETKKGVNVNVFYSFLENNEINNFRLGNEGQKIKFFDLHDLKKIKLTPDLKNYLSKNYDSLFRAISENSFSSFELIT